MAKSSAARKKSARRQADDITAEKAAENASESKRSVKSSEAAEGKRSAKPALNVVHESRGIKGMYETVVKFLKSVKTEMGRVTWPTGPELRRATLVVIATLLIVSGFMAAVDWGLSLIFGKPATGF